jgi:hypothetical protein
MNIFLIICSLKIIFFPSKRIDIVENKIFTKYSEKFKLIYGRNIENHLFLNKDNICALSRE